MISGQTNPEPKGYIFDIQGLSVHDGPGCRTLVFLNGCTLNCFWCSNPEGIGHKPSLLYFETKCISCGNCIGACQNGAIHFDSDKRLLISRNICITCQARNCTTVCYTTALRFSGGEMSVSGLYDILRRDRQYWGHRGGITLTGGEPLLQLEFVRTLLERCYESYIHTAIETCGNVPWENFRQVLPYLDWIFFDLKHPGDVMHKNATGASNTQILDNALRLSREFQGRLVFRMPLIPGFNDGDQEIQALIDFISESGRKEINILPLHHLGREKYSLLGKEYKAAEYRLPGAEEMLTLKDRFHSAGIECNIGSETPF